MDGSEFQVIAGTDPEHECVICEDFAALLIFRDGRKSRWSSVCVDPACSKTMYELVMQRAEANKEHGLTLQ